MRTKRPYTDEDVERDRASLAILNAPANRTKILGLIAAGHSLEHVIEVGKHHRSWTVEDVRRALASTGVRPPLPAFGGGARPGPNAKPVKLDPDQIDVLREMCTGAGVEIIASRLFLAPPTVMRQVSRICAALGADDRAHAIALVLTGRVRVLTSLPPE